MTSHYLAVDLGAQSGRMILGTLHNRKRLVLHEIHRFPNQMVKINRHLHWDIHRLFSEIKKGLLLCALQHVDPIASIGIDAWGVDFCLLDRQGKFLGLPYSYRDQRTMGMIEKFTRKMPARELYRRTGVQLHRINTVFQLYAMVREQHSALAEAASLLFMPDIFNYLLTGKKYSEFTIATTSQIYNPSRRTWDNNILDQIGVGPGFMPQILEPGTPIGDLASEISDATKLSPTPVIAVASHDTGSAVAAVPAHDDQYVYISSGTWSLMGIETKKPLINDHTFANNFTNEGGVNGTYRLLKNITGLFLLEECRKVWEQRKKITYQELYDQAAHAAPLRSIIDPDNHCFFAAEDMPASIQSFCQKTGQPVPVRIREFTRCILESLALAYGHTLESLNKFRTRRIERIHVVGGGSRTDLLNQLTADATGLPVYAGPQEATAIGNILVQAMAAGQLGSLDELRAVVRTSFKPVIYRPRNVTGMDRAYAQFLALKKSGRKRRGYGEPN